jgi:hypothetical protein
MENVKREYRWSEPFYGVQHLLGLPKSHQITIAEYETYTNAVVLALHSSTPFTPVAERDFDTPAEAREWGERYASALIAGVA